MTATFEAIGMAHLSPEARREFARQLLTDAETPAPPGTEDTYAGISPEFLAELERRAERARSHPEESIDGEVFFKQLLKELGE